MKYVDVHVRSIIEKAQGNNLFTIMQAINNELELEALSES
jgi:hypothetical protein